MGPVIPNTVVVRHRARQCPWSPPSAVVDMWSLTYSVPGMDNALRIGKDAFSDDALILLDSGGGPTNAAQIDALDRQFIADFYSWRSTQFDDLFAGYVSPTPNGLIDTIEWDLDSDAPKTRMFTTPNGFAFRELGHQIHDPDASCPDGSDTSKVATRTPCVQMFGPPEPSGTGTRFSVWRVCLEDGRLRQYYDGTDTCSSSCSCETTICVTGCPDGTEVDGATVTVKKTDGTMVGTCTTVSDGLGNACCSICLDGGVGTGDYEVVVSATGYITFDAILHLTCNGTTEIQLQEEGFVPCQVQVAVGGCDCAGNIVGVTVTIGGQTFVTEDGGKYGIYGIWYAPGPGTYAASVSLCGFKTATFNIIVSDDCSCTWTTSEPLNCTLTVEGPQIQVILVPLDGYECGANGPYAEPDTLYLTDSIYGTCTLTYDAGSGNWLGSITGCAYPAENYGGGGNCPASTGFTIFYTLGSCGGLSAAWNAVDCGSCVIGNFTFNAGVVPQDTPAPLPCVDGNPVTGCFGNVPAGCLQAFSKSWGNAPSNVCPMDSTWSFPAGPLTNPDAANPGALWTNFGPGTIVVTE